MKRLLAAQAFAISCFVAFPLRFSFDRPSTEGLPGWMFDVLMGFDKPFNQVPSLHIVLLVILWVLYAKHVPFRLRWLVHTWSFVIGTSVLTTYQHHFIDVPTGIWVGSLCLWLFPEDGPAVMSRFSLTRDAGRRRIALWYALAGLGIAALAVAVGGAPCSCSGRPARCCWWP